MTIRAPSARVAYGRRRGLAQGAIAPIALLAGALVVGVLAATRPTLAVGLVVAAVAALLIASDVRMLPPFLVVAVFAEGVSVGGFNLGRVVGPLALAAVAYYLLVGGRANLRRASPLMVAAIAFGIWIVFSLYWATDNHFAVVWFFKWALSLGFAVAFAVLVQEEKHVTAVLAAFVVAAVAFGLVGLLTYVGSGGASRGSGLTGDPNQFAAYEALAVPAALVLAGTERWSGRRPPLYFGIAVIVLSIVASYSRGGFLTLGVILVGTLAVSWRVFFRSPTEKGTYIGLLVFVGWIILVVGSTAYVHRIDTIFTGSDRGSGRTDLWSAAWRGYTQHPYLGLGAGGFEAHSLDLLHTTPGVDITASYVRADRPVHNAYLESLVDLGPLGLALFLAVVGLTFSYLVRSARRFRLAGRGRLWRMTVGLTVSYVGLAGAMLFLSIGLGHMLWIFVGLALALDTMSGREPEPAPPERVPRRSALPLGGREGSVQA